MISTRALIFCSEIAVYVPTAVTLYSLAVCFCKNCFGNAHQSMADGPTRGEAKRKKMAFGLQTEQKSILCFLTPEGVIFAMDQFSQWPYSI